MTAVAQASGPSSIITFRVLPARTVGVAAFVAVVCRLPFLHRALGADEAGFLMVGRQWNGSGTSLYGNYWVDRPPLLVTIFRIAAAWGGTTALRLIGCLAVVLLVWGSAWTARAIGGVQAGRWAAICAAALCISPLLGSYAINGELLAAPFVVLGLGCVVVSLRSEAPRQAFAYAATAGALALGALAIKQNFADVAVFGVVALVGALWRRDVTARRFVGLAEAGLGGAVLALLALVVWTWTHGTSPVGVFDATYPFRIHAGRVMAASGNQPAALRLHHLLVFALISGVVLLGSIVMADLVRRRRRCAVWWALLATLVFGVASVMVGGNYWRHYLIQLIGPMSVAIGVLAAQRRPAARLAVTYVVVAAVLAWVHLFSAPTGNIGTTIGSAVSRSAHPGDTIVTAWGHANVDQVSGLRSPYVHLWSLPTKTLDPKLEGLDAVLRGPDAPTYVIAWNHLRSWGLHTTLIQRIVAERYRPVAQLCGRTIYLLDGVDRPAPRLTTTCRGTRLAAS